MTLEGCQILFTVCREEYGVNKGYKSTHVNHPCVKWARKSYSNFCWLFLLTTYLAAEYTFRYGKIHKCEEIIVSMLDIYAMAGYFASKNKPLLKIDTPALAMPDDCKTDDPIQSYRNYYLKYKSHLLTYTRRDIPEWVKAIGLGTWKEGKII